MLNGDVRVLQTTTDWPVREQHLSANHILGEPRAANVNRQRHISQHVWLVQGTDSLGVSSVSDN